jgi:hypothetical protein
VKMKFIGYALIFGLIGAAVGYFLFAKFGGQYIPVTDLFFHQKGVINNIGDALTGGNEIRQNIYIAGGIGAVIGILFSTINNKKKR